MAKPTVNLQQIKTLRRETGVGIMEAKKALSQSGGDAAKAKALLRQWGAEQLAGRADKTANEGQVFAYSHHDGRLGVLVKLTCETDFVARSKEFQTLGKELALQVAGMEPKTVSALMKQAYIRDASKTVAELVSAAAVKVKEKLTVAEFARMKA